ncbi:uncharacterized protein BDR25DRAFT_110560 [Lindgomyces ingoldianus]|uniref:Uncharacterized protein n=1 Tax=Lindgomyces ingoldianus TaxID=673940 RepID=A0ACB6R5S4_9PLEO|nr:uncharacterized protein BDR25DRAFT_110560 [Lindgomyces ingoldianus]KAF2474628.1 hypothetical protein BDR25DRAFT_110560 [Lindgomyces ingoldianus]
MPSSQVSDVVRWAAHLEQEHYSDEPVATLPMKPKARLNSDDIRGLGAGFEEIVAPSPPEIEIKLEIEDTVGQRNPSPLVQSPSHGNKLPLTNSSHPGASRQPDPVALEATLTHESLRTPERSSKGGSSRRSRNSCTSRNSSFLFARQPM